MHHDPMLSCNILWRNVSCLYFPHFFCRLAFTVISSFKMSYTSLYLVFFSLFPNRQIKGAAFMCALSHNMSYIELKKIWTGSTVKFLAPSFFFTWDLYSLSNICSVRWSQFLLFFIINQVLNVTFKFFFLSNITLNRDFRVGGLSLFLGVHILGVEILCDDTLIFRQ